MYAKPMRGHGLMQAIAASTASSRTNRAGSSSIISARRRAETGISDLYRERRQPARPQSTRPRRSRSCWRNTSLPRIFYGFDLSPLTQGPAQQRDLNDPCGAEFILAQECQREIFAGGHRPSVPSPCRCRTTRPCASATRSAFSRLSRGVGQAHSDDRKPPEVLDHAIRQIVSKALVSDESSNIFAAAGLKSQTSRSYPRRVSR